VPRCRSPNRCLPQQQDTTPYVVKNLSLELLKTGKICPKHVELILEINKLLLLHLVSKGLWLPCSPDFVNVWFSPVAIIEAQSLRIKLSHFRRNEAEFFEELLRLSKPPICVKCNSTWQKEHKTVLIHKNLISSIFCKTVRIVCQKLD